MFCPIPENTEPTETIPPVQGTRYVPEARALAQMTTIGVGGSVTKTVNADSAAELTEAVSEADREGTECLIVGGGSNILAADADFPGPVIHDQRSSIEILADDGCSGARFRVAGGTPWDAVVAFSVEHGWMGLEGLSGIPGTAGAAPVQNIGAYGQDVSAAVAAVRTFDRKTGLQKTFFLSDMRFGYRSSILKESILSGRWGNSPRWIVLDVEFHLRRATLGSPIRYKQLAQKLDTQIGQRVPAADVRRAVLELRAAKGMVLNDADRDTYSLGSFFTNPVLTEEQARLLPPDAPRFKVGDSTAVNQIGAAAPAVPGLVKTSAAWLIDHAGFAPGFSLTAAASLSTKHTLALTNRGNAKAADIMALARHIADGVAAKFGVNLVPEPVLVGLRWN